MTNQTEILADIQRDFAYFAQLDNKMQLSTALVFMEIARAHLRSVDITNRDIELKLGLRSGTVTRNVYYWTAEGHPTNTGSAGFVSVHVSLLDRRQRNLKLTPKGVAFLNNLTGF